MKNLLVLFVFVSLSSCSWKDDFKTKDLYFEVKNNQPHDVEYIIEYYRYHPTPKGLLKASFGPYITGSNKISTFSIKGGELNREGSEEGFLMVKLKDENRTQKFGDLEWLTQNVYFNLEIKSDTIIVE